MMTKTWYTYTDLKVITRGRSCFTSAPQRKQQELGDMMDLSSYLLRPIQRISKYSLLLQDMLALAPSPHDPQYQLGPAGGSAGVPDMSGGDRQRERAEIRSAADLVKFQMRHGNDLLTMDAIQDCDVRFNNGRQCDKGITCTFCESFPKTLSLSISHSLPSLPIR